MGVKMPLYFFDLDNGKFRHVDTLGSDLPDLETARKEAVRFLAAVFKDAAPDQGDCILVVRVRDEAGRVVFSNMLKLRSDFLEAAGLNAGGQRSPVLVVEDEDLSRMTAVEMIADAGFEVVEANNADEAIAILKARPDIKAVFTDILMPGSMDGLELARFIREKWPSIQVIATSGRFAISDDDLPEGGIFLPKPYTIDGVTTVLRGLDV
jgi:CheY-like chemotaxis protein